MSESIYLSGSEIRELAHYGHWIPVTKGLTHAYVTRTYPGWTFNSLYPPLIASGLLKARGQSFSPRRLVDGIIGVEINRSGVVTGDDGSSLSDARLESWMRADGHRVSEHLMVSNHAARHVIIHVPHGSRRLPDRCRAEFAVTPAGLRREITASTDQGTTQLAAMLDERRNDSLIAAAALSRLYFDAERFPEDDPTEAFGRGVVYTTTSTGRSLRHPIADDRMAIYRQEQRLYTASMEHVVRRSLEQIGTALIIDVHSYPERPQFFEDRTRRRPEVCLGTDAFHTPEELKAIALMQIGQRYEVVLNEPYSGTYVPGSLYGTEPRVYSIMIEARRDIVRTSEGRRRLAELLDRTINAWLASQK